MKHTISAVSAESYTTEAMDRAVQAHFAALRVEELIRPGMSVCLKPNLLMKSAPKNAVTTHPALVEAVVRQLVAVGVPVERITIADSPGGPYLKTALEGIYKAAGLTEVSARTGAVLNYGTGAKTLRREENELCKEFHIIDPIAEADLVINLPKLKTHGMVTLSAGVKNLFGCVPGLEKPELHFRFKENKDFCQMLVDLSALVAPGLTIVDAVESMEGNGPSGGTVRHTGMTFAARDIYALDLGLCTYMSLPPEAVWTVQHAIAAGFCTREPNALTWLGERPEVQAFALPASTSIDFTSRLPRFLRRPATYLEERFFAPRPVIVKSKCIGCGKCAESCAPEAAVIQERKAVIRYEKCIKCYCCHEMCPVRAIEIKRSGLLS